MIESLSLTNFKSIKRHTFKLGNLNVVLGLNGMGKSSFIQSLLLLRQSQDLQKGLLRLSGNHLDLGRGRDVFYQYGTDEIITFEIGFTDQGLGRFDFVYNADADYLQNNAPLALSQDFFNQSLFGNRFQYLASSRIDPTILHEKSYSAVQDDRYLGDHGEYTAHFLSVYGTKEIEFDNLKHPKATSDQLLEQVNSWMGEISPGVKFSLTDIPNSNKLLLHVQFAQPSLGYTNSFSPVNVGFGISYVLPIVTSILAASDNHLIIIENPESHIHPRGQAELGRLIALAAANDVQIIVETHSDHIVNGIRVAAKMQEIASDRISMFSFERQVNEREQFSRVTGIEMNSNGELSEYPKNFLDEWSNQLMKLV